MTETVVTQAVSDAMKWQADARIRNNDSPLAPADMFRHAAQALGSPGGRMAVAILAVAGLHPVPLGDALKPSSGPLVSFAGIYQHSVPVIMTVQVLRLVSIQAGPCWWRSMAPLQRGAGGKHQKASKFTAA